MHRVSVAAPKIESENHKQRIFCLYFTIYRCFLLSSGRYSCVQSMLTLFVSNFLWYQINISIKFIPHDLLLKHKFYKKINILLSTATLFG